MANLVGQRLSQYEILSLLGEGGMAVVYKASRLNLRSEVAIKVIKSGLLDSDRLVEFVKRFEFEAQTIASLSHPHILKLFDFGQYENMVYLVMELLTGGSLAQLIQKSPLAVDETLRILDQVGEALDYAHKRGIIHRDLKPQNILLDERANAILTDFGIAKLMDETTDLTGSNVAIGTPAYMAPEQWRGEHVDARVDIYALGIVLFQMLSGSLPFRGDTPHSMMHMHIYTSPPSLRQFRPDISGQVDAVLEVALAKAADDRYRSVMQFVTAFKAAVGAPPKDSRPRGIEAATGITVQSGPTPAQAASVQTPLRRCFISYARRDQDFAEQVRHQIHLWGHPTWMDVHDIPKGSYWPNAIDQGLESSEVIIGLMSPDAIASRNVCNEWDWALENNRLLLLLMLNPAEHIPHRYISISYIDFSHDQRAAFAQLEAALTSQSTPYRDAHTTVPATSRARPSRQSNRSRMLDKVNDFWIVGVLENAMHERKSLDLELEFAAPGTLLKHLDHSDYELPTSANILGVFEDMNRELLILGQPGAGKTVLLLQLTRELIVAARNDETQPIPVVFNLSSWAVRRVSIEAWLMDELRVKYQVPRKLAGAWISNGQVLPLLDGLDEVKSDYRDTCIEAINGFRQDYDFVDMVVCSRIEDYQQLSHRLNLNSSIVLQPLTQRQVDKHLMNSELDGLRTILQTDPLLQAMTKTPFLLNTMTFAYRGRSAASLAGTFTEADRRSHLFQTYVERKFRQSRDQPFTLKQTLHWLSVLAYQMNSQNQTVFFIERMQPSWLPMSQRWQYVAWAALVGALLGGGGSGLVIAVVGHTFGAATALLGGSLVGLTFGLAVGIYYGLSAYSADIEVTEALSWSWARGRVGLAIGLIGGLLGAALYSVLYGSLIGLPFGLVIGLTIGLAFGLTGALGGGQLEMKTLPNQGVRRSAWNAVTIGLIFGLGFNLAAAIIFGVLFALALGTAANLATKFAFGITSGVTFGLVGGLTFGLALALLRGGKSVIEHVVLRMLLNRGDEIPANYSQFLDYTAQLNILRRVGGGYIFVHRYLLDYFASLRK